MRTPSARSACSVASTWLLFSSSSVSVISSSSRFGRQAGLLQRIHHQRQQIADAELQRRQVDRDADVVGPLRRIHAGAAQHQAAERR